MSETQLADNEAARHNQHAWQTISHLDDAHQASPDLGSIPQHAALPLITGALQGRTGMGLRAQAMQQMQSTHGNRAVQRYMTGSASNAQVAVQRAPQVAPDAAKEEEDAPKPDEEVRKARKGRSVVSNAARVGREGTKVVAATDAKAARVAAQNKTFVEHEIKAPTGNPDEALRNMDAYRNAERAQQAAENTTKNKLTRALEKHTGRTSPVGRGLRGANYGLQFGQNLAEGQDVGEAASGAAAGGYTSNNMSRHLFNKSPKVGWVDTGVNLLNAGLNLIPGMPEEVTTVTQTAADATPSSFATSLASNAGRGLWNTGKGLITGDWSSLKEQGHDLTHGKAGAPLQGYATTVEAIVAGVSGDSEALDKIRDENRSGERGKLAQLGSKLGRWSRDTQESMAEWIVDNVDLDPLGMYGGNDGPSEAEQQKNQAEFMAKRDKELADIEKNKDQIMKEQGPQAYYRMMATANLPPQVRGSM